MDPVTCLHCGSTSLKTILRHQSRATFRCNDCGGFLNDPEKDTDHLYDKDYYERNYLPRQDARLRESRWQMEIIGSIVPRGSVLDYGCGNGIFLRVAAEYGHAQNVGADVSRDGLRIGKQNVEDTVQLVHLPTEDLPDRQFEIVALIDSLSAIRNPRDTVLTLKNQHLMRNGVLVIRTPHLPPSYFRAVVMLSRIIGPRYGSNLMFTKVRYILFNMISLKRFVESLGFVVVDLRLTRDYFHPLRFDTITSFLKTSALRLFYWKRRSIFLIAQVKR